MEKWLPYDKFEIEDGTFISRILFDKNGLIISIEKNDLIKEIIFSDVYGYKFTNESGMIDRLSRIPIELLRENKMFLIDESDYKNEYEFQSSGTRPMDKVQHFILLDGVDNIVEILAVSEPTCEFI